MTLSVALDFIVIALLVTTIIYVFILNRKLATLYEGKEDLRHFLETFAESLTQAKAGVEYLKKVSLESSKDLQDKIRQAKDLSTEFNLFIDNAEKIAAQLKNTSQVSPLSRTTDHDSFPLYGKKDVQTTSPSGAPIPKYSYSKVEPRLVQALRGLK
jgi:hypothetical protein